MIPFDQIAKVFSFVTEKKYCVEIQFKLAESEKFDLCWMGKMWGKKEKKEIYWYGLPPDGSNAYEFDSFDQMTQAPVFDGLNLQEGWDCVVIEEIDGCDPNQRLQDYVNRK